MTENNTTETNESQEGLESGDDSALVKDLRSQIKNLTRELNAVPKRADIEAEVRASLARTNAIERELVALNQPVGLSELVEGKLGDTEVTREKVVEVLTAIGFSISDETEGETQEQVATNLAEVANLSNQIAGAASGQTKDDLGDKIAAAETPEELAQVMREAGLGG